jgi:hypothetical protein
MGEASRGSHSSQADGLESNDVIVVIRNSCDRSYNDRAAPAQMNRSTIIPEEHHSWPG